MTAAAIALGSLCLVGSKAMPETHKLVWVLRHVTHACYTSAGAVARLEGVNKPELLPKEFTTVIDVAGFLTNGEVECSTL